MGDPLKLVLTQQQSIDGSGTSVRLEECPAADAVAFAASVVIAANNALFIMHNCRDWNGSRQTSCSKGLSSEGLETAPFTQAGSGRQGQFSICSSSDQRVSVEARLWSMKEGPGAATAQAAPGLLCYH